MSVASPLPTSNRCRICHNDRNNRLWRAREMMFGFRDEFLYLECSTCGCVQLENTPEDMRKYYPPNYYSFQRHGFLKRQLRKRWSAYAMGGLSPVGWMLSTFIFPNRALMALRRVDPDREMRILDVGCGSGNLLLDLHYLGFRHLTGLDPYIATDLHYPGGITIHKKPLNALRAEFDIIMLHHSFEHMDAPLEVMRSMAAMLHENGLILIRIPVASSFAWREYRTNWVNLDAPRHFFLHTARSMEVLAEQSGLKIKRAFQEGDEGLFAASEAYAIDIPMSDPRFPFSTPSSKILQWRKIEEYKRKARMLNRNGEADQVCFELVKASPKAG